MRLYAYAFLLGIIFSVIGLIFLAVNTDPDSASLFIKALFFLTLFIGFWGVAGLASFLIRRSRVSLRQGFFAAVGASYVLLLFKVGLVKIEFLLPGIAALVSLEILLLKKNARV